VCCPKDGLADSQAARNHVFQWLSDNGFTGGGGFFQNYFSDWYVIGGRWSGELTAKQMDQKKVNSLNKEFNEKFGFWISKDVSEEMRQEQYRGLTQQYFPDYKGLPWAFRNSYKTNGFEDDAQIVNERIYDAIIKDNLMEKVDTEKLWNGGAIITTDTGEKSLSNKPDFFIGKYWLVVVDFHF
jgi:hypothetical protein